MPKITDIKSKKPGIGFSGSVRTWRPEDDDEPLIPVSRELIETRLAESKLAESKLAESKLAESKLAESKLAESKLAESKLAESKLAESNLAESKLAESKLAESKLAESKLAESKLAESKLAESKLAESKLASSYSGEKHLNRNKRSTPKPTRAHLLAFPSEMTDAVPLVNTYSKPQGRWMLPETDVLELLASTNKEKKLTGNQWPVLLFMSLKAYAFDKETNMRRNGIRRFSASYLSHGLGLPTSTCNNTVNDLISKGYIQLLERNTYEGNLYQVAPILLYNPDPGEKEKSSDLRNESKESRTSQSQQSKPQRSSPPLKSVALNLPESFKEYFNSIRAPIAYKQEYSSLQEIMARNEDISVEELEECFKLLSADRDASGNPIICRFTWMAKGLDKILTRVRRNKQIENRNLDISDTSEIEAIGRNQTPTLGTQSVRSQIVTEDRRSIDSENEISDAAKFSDDVLLTLEKIQGTLRRYEQEMIRKDLREEEFDAFLKAYQLQVQILKQELSDKSVFSDTCDVIAMNEVKAIQTLCIVLENMNISSERKEIFFSRRRSLESNLSALNVYGLKTSEDILNEWTEETVREAANAQFGVR